MRYFFHLLDGSRFVDPLGRELADDDRAMGEAKAAARHFADAYPEKAAAAKVIVNDAHAGWSGRSAAAIRWSGGRGVDRRPPKWTLSASDRGTAREGGTARRVRGSPYGGPDGITPAMPIEAPTIEDRVFDDRTVADPAPQSWGSVPVMTP